MILKAVAPPQPAPPRVAVTSMWGESTSQTVRDPRMMLELGSARYAITWFFVTGLHATCAVYLTLLGSVYRFIAHPYMLYYGKLAAGDRQPYLGLAGAVAIAISALHWWQLLCTAYASVRARKLMFASGISMASNAMSVLSDRLSSFPSGHIKKVEVPRSRTLMRLRQLAWKIWSPLFSSSGVFGIESPVFHVVFTARELVEIVSQTVQAHSSSELLPRPWLNNLFILLVVVNCWSTPILQHLLHHREGAERVICLLFDTLLNMGTSMAIPLAAFLPYHRAFSLVTLTFPPQNYFDTVWFSQLVMELQFLFALSNLDVISKLISQIGIYSSLVSAGALIQLRSNSSGGHGGTSHQKVVGAKTPGPTAKQLVLSEVTGTQIVKTASRWKVLAHAFFVMWGAGLLAVHIRASVLLQRQVPGCRLATGSWYTNGYPCSVYTHNCYRQGSNSPDEASWTHLDPETLVFLTVTHCPGLKVPHRLQSFPNLVAFQLHNVTLVEWRKENAVSATKQLKMIVLAFTRINMTEIPEGLLEPLPHRLMTFRIARSNLTTLPSDLHLKWHPLTTVTIEHTLVSEFPKTLLSLGLRELSLHGNQIATCTELRDAHQHFFSLVLTANPLTELPDSLGAGTSFSFFSAERTLLKTVPAWVHTNVKDTMYLAGTPFCGAHAGEVGGTPFLACVKRDNRGNGKFPVEVIDSYLIP